MERGSFFSASRRDAAFWLRVPLYLWMYLMFGVGFVLLTAGTLLPLSARAMRRWASWLARGWIWVGRGIGSFELEQSGVPAAGGTLMVANHPSLIDVVLLIARLEDVCCVVKGDAARAPVVGLLVRRLGWISNDEPETMLERSADALRAGERLLVFPESTRTVPGEPVRFKLGAAEIAARADAAVQPILIRYRQRYLSKACPWYEFPEEPVYFGISFEAARIAAAGNGDRRTARRQIARDLQHYFDTRLLA